MKEFLKEKTNDMEVMFKGIHKDIDKHLQLMIADFLNNIENFQGDFV